MTGLAAVLDLLLELEDHELRAECLAEDRRADARTVDDRGTDGDRLAIADQQDAVERDEVPASAASRSIMSSLPASTRYCFPPVVTTAYMVFSWD